MFGILTLKPQLGLVVPIMLCLTRNWRCIIAATITVAALVAVTSLIYGADIWGAYFRVAVPWQNYMWKIFQRPDVTAMPTAFMNMRTFGASVELAWMVQLPISITAFATIIWAFWRRRDPILSQALFVTASFLVTPYAFVYDLVIFGWVAVKLREHNNNALIDDLIMLSIWALPIVSTPYPFNGIPAFSIFLMILMARLLWRLYRNDLRLSFRKEVVSAPN